MLGMDEDLTDTLILMLIFNLINNKIHYHKLNPQTLTIYFLIV
jgi:hypothetical protein